MISAAEEASSAPPGGCTTPVARSISDSKPWRGTCSSPAGGRRPAPGFAVSLAGLAPACPVFPRLAPAPGDAPLALAAVFARGEVLAGLALVVAAALVARFADGAAFAL